MYFRSRSRPAGIDDAARRKRGCPPVRGIRTCRHMLKRTGWLLQHPSDDPYLPPSGDENRYTDHHQKSGYPLVI